MVKWIASAAWFVLPRPSRYEMWIYDVPSNLSDAIYWAALRSDQFSATGCETFKRIYCVGCPGVGASRHDASPQEVKAGVDPSSISSGVFCGYNARLIYVRVRTIQGEDTVTLYGEGVGHNVDARNSLEPARQSDTY